MTFEDVIKGRPASIPLDNVSAVVTAVTPAGILVAPEGQPDDNPIGPCRGPRTAGGRTITAGMHVLVTFAGRVPWIIAVDS